jgi:hypothetical protein
MNATTKVLCATIALLSVAACSTAKTAPTSLPPGQYTQTQKSTNAAGTTTEKTTNTNVYYDQYGNKRAIQETETSKDPQGLLNKKTTTTTKTY